MDAVTVAPDPRFYATFTPDEVDAIVRTLAERREFPYQYTYLGDGGRHWEAFRKTVVLARTAEALIDRHVPQILSRLPGRRPIRVVDLGPGDTDPVRGLLRHLLDASRLERYVALDISAEILALAERNLRASFPDDVDRFRFHRGDFTGPDLTAVLGARRDAADPARLVVLTGGTLHNLADPDRMLRLLATTMSAQDRLLLTVRVDVGDERRDFPTTVRAGTAITPQHRAGLDALNVDPSWYVSETGFDPERSEVFVRARFTRPVTVAVDVAGSPRTLSFRAGDAVRLFRYLYLDEAAALRHLERNGLAVRLRRFSDDGMILLVVLAPAAVTEPGDRHSQPSRV